MATYKQIQGYVKEKEGFTVKTCWIADVKEQCGLSPKVSPNRISSTCRQNPCPPEKAEATNLVDILTLEECVAKANQGELLYTISKL